MGMRESHFVTMLLAIQNTCVPSGRLTKETILRRFSQMQMSLVFTYRHRYHRKVNRQYQSTPNTSLKLPQPTLTSRRKRNP